MKIFIWNLLLDWLGGILIHLLWPYSLFVTVQRKCLWIGTWAQNGQTSPSPMSIHPLPVGAGF